MKIYLGCDHAGFELKQKVMAALPDMDWQDQGTFSLDSVDYPDFADKVCHFVHRTELENQKNKVEDSLKGPCLGLLICGSGQGMAIRANKYKTIRAALCWNSEVASLSREHNNANILCLGARFLQTEEAVAIIKTFFQTAFAGGRHSRRVEKMSRDTDC